LDHRACLLRRKEFGNVMSRLPWDSNLPRLIRCLIIVAASAVVNSSAQALPTFDQIVVFGDSLSDNGNAGRASNGPVWVEPEPGRSTNSRKTV
jgi:hypothetical protein